MEEKEKLYQKDIKETRNYGLDLLRIVAMFMIVCLHINSHGGLLSVPTGGKDVFYYFSWAGNAICIGAVNMFVLISGYFLVNQTFRLQRIVKLVLQVWFYSWIIGVIAFARGSTGLLSLDTIKALFPISFGQYWFVAAYIGMCLLSPVLNRLIHSLSQKQHLCVVFLLVGMTCLWYDILPMANPFWIGEGSNLMWFLVLYFIAAYIRLYINVERVRHTFTVYLFASFVLVLSMLVLSYLSDRVSLLTEYSLTGYYYRYNSIFVLIASVALFLTFAKLKIKKAVLVKLIRYVSPIVIGVYLIHDNAYLRNVIWNELFCPSKIARDILLPVKAFGIVLLIFVVCIIIDYLRASLFALVESRRWYKNAMKKIDNSVHIISDKIFEKLGGIYK